MPTFAYTARDAAGVAVEGTLAAATLDEATRAIRALGRYPTAVRPQAGGVVGRVKAAGGAKAAGGTKAGAKGVAPSSSAAPSRGRGGIKVTRDEVVQISNQLAIMLDTGVTLSEALGCCAEFAGKSQSKALLDDLMNRVNGGQDFSDALAAHPRSFPRLYVALIKASERTGMMSQLLGRATTYLKDEQEILRKVKGALTYPGIMFGFAVLTTIFLLAFVMPRFTTIYANKGAALPVPTKVLMAMSDFMVTQWMFIIPGVIVGAACLWSYLRTPAGTRTWDWAMLNAPLIGSMFRKLYLSRGLRMVGTMANAGVPLVDCVETAGALCANGQFRAMWEEVGHQIQNGRAFSEPLSKSPLVPGAVSRMLASGERGGKLGVVMEQVAGFSETELKEKIHELTRYIEPAMIMLMGLLIGSVTLALLLPIFSISKVVAN